MRPARADERDANDEDDCAKVEDWCDRAAGNREPAPARRWGE